jgi:hypothetical protein
MIPRLGLAFKANTSIYPTERLIGVSPDIVRWGMGEVSRLNGPFSGPDLLISIG